ncbi:hypothetical protein [Streptomyces sp. NPDC001770]
MTTPSLPTTPTASAPTIEVGEEVLEGFEKKIASSVKEADAKAAYQELVHYATASGFGPSGFNKLLAGSTDNYEAARDLAARLTGYSAALEGIYTTFRNAVDDLRIDLGQVRTLIGQGTDEAEAIAASWLVEYLSGIVGDVSSAHGGTGAPAPTTPTTTKTTVPTT